MENLNKKETDIIDVFFKSLSDPLTNEEEKIIEKYLQFDFNTKIINELMLRLNKYLPNNTEEYYVIKNGIQKSIDEYKNSLTNKSNKKYRLNDDEKKAIDIIKSDIKILDNIFDSDLHRLIINRNTYAKDVKIYKLQQDLIKLYEFVKGKKGTKSIKYIQNNVSFEILDDTYLYSLYHSNQYDLQKNITNIILNFTNTVHRSTITHIIDIFFKTHTYFKLHEELENRI